MTTEQLIDAIEAVTECQLAFPNPFPGEFGLVTGRGISTYRAIHAVYQAWRLRCETVGLRRPRIVEIGGGLGRTAYAARAFGLVDYTIVDIPSTSVAQAYFLGRVLGPNAICLYGEPPRRDAIKIIPPPALFAADERFDIMLNVDSLPEMDLETARSYISFARHRTNIFLSINHEGNIHSVHKLLKEAGLVATRCPYWLRAGYVEERVALRRGWFRR